MRSLALIRKPLVLLAALVALFAFGGGAGTTHAAATTISPAPTTVNFTQGAWNGSGATLTAPVDAIQNHILITDDTVLCQYCVVRVGDEYMSIVRFEHGALHAPDTMVVNRGWNGSASAAHGSGTAVKARTVSASIYAYNVTSAATGGWGLGAFTVVVGFPAGATDVNYVKLTAEPAWLGSTGRTVSCDGFKYEGENIWQITCNSTGYWQDSGHPLGPMGSGVIASLTLQAQQSVGTQTVNIWGDLLNTTGTSLSPTAANLDVRVRPCPDANLDTWVDAGDIGTVARNINDEGVDSGAILVSQVDTSQTSMAISDQSKLVVGDTIAVETEQMTVTALHDSAPDTMTVTRASNGTRAKSHSSGIHIYRATFDGNGDGKKGYTDPRDVNDDGYVDPGDIGIISRTLVVQCPAP